LLKTAHEGEWLGQKWSALWIPLRIAIAAAAVLPVFPNQAGGNYSAVQAAIVWAEANAVGMADKAWALSAKYIIKDPIGGVTLNHQSVNRLANHIMMNDVCMLELNRAAAHTPMIRVIDPSPIAFYTNAVTFQSVTQSVAQDVVNLGLNTGDLLWNGHEAHPFSTFYNQDYWGLAVNSPLLRGALNAFPSPHVCGSITFPTRASGGSSVQAAIDNAVWSSSQQQMQTMLSGESQIAQNIVDRVRPSRAQYAQLIHNYENGVITSALKGIQTAEKPATQKFLTSMKEQGFATAGSWWWELMHMNQIAQDAMSNIGTSSTPGVGILSGDIPYIGRYMSSGEGRTVRFLHAYAIEHQSGEQGSPASKMPQASDASIAGIMDAVFQGVVGQLGEYLSDEPRNKNPILGLEHIGTLFIAAGTGMYAIEGAGEEGSAIGRAVSSAPVLGHIAKPISKGIKNTLNSPLGMLFTFLATAFVGIGIVLTVWIPMLPYIIWTFAIFGLLIFFIEAIFAGPFWAIGHMNPEGHEVVGSGARGWMTLLQLLLKPVLMVAGLIAGTALLYAGAWILQHTIGGAILDTFTNSAGGFVGPLDGLAQAVIYCFMLIVFIDMSFGLIHKLPDMVMAWIGGQSTDRGEKEMQDREGKGREGFKDSSQEGFKTLGGRSSGQ
jgi:conjugal transfer/type IV secretion protein DotA/TraY